MTDDDSLIPRTAIPVRADDDAASQLLALALSDSDAVRGGGRTDLIERAAELRAQLDNAALPTPSAAAWRFGFAHHVRGEYQRAIEYFTSADLTAEVTTDVERALIAAGHASAQWAQGNAALGRTLADESLALATDAGDDLAIATAWIAQALIFAAEGDRTANLRAYETALVHAERAGDAPTIARIRSNMGSMHTEEGRFAAALDEVDQAIALAESIDIGVIGALAFINRAEALLAMGRLDEALAEAHVAVDTYRAAGSPMHIFALLLEADIHRVRGNATRAEVAYRDAIVRADRTRDAQVLTAAYAGLARTLIAEDAAAAASSADLALSQPTALGDVAARLAAGWVALAAGDATAAREHARRAIEESGRRRNVSALADALELGALARWSTNPSASDVAPMLAEAADIWNETGDPIRIAVNRAVAARVDRDRVAEDVAQRTLRALGVRVDVFRIAGPLQVIGRIDSPATEIRTLGTFAVLRHGNVVAAESWPSRKSREVVKVLASRRGRPISRDALAELLWPGVPNTSARLSVALSNARAVLDPERQHPADHFITASQSQVRLDPETVRIDVAAFEQLARSALQSAVDRRVDALASLQAAAALYPAPLLVEERSAEWLIEVQEEMRELATAVKRALVRLLIDDGADPEQPIGWLTSLLNDDPFDESTHRALISVLATARRFGDARRAYRHYASRMAELDVPAVPLEQLIGFRLGT